MLEKDKPVFLAVQYILNDKCAVAVHTINKTTREPVLVDVLTIFARDEADILAQFTILGELYQYRDFEELVYIHYKQNRPKQLLKKYGIKRVRSMLITYPEKIRLLEVCNGIMPDNYSLPAYFEIMGDPILRRLNDEICNTKICIHPDGLQTLHHKDMKFMHVWGASLEATYNYLAQRHMVKAL